MEAWTPIRWANPWVADAMAAAPGRLPGDRDTAALDEDLRLGSRLAATSATLALATPPIDLIDLPSSTTSPEDQARLRSAAPLYLVAELDSSGLVRGAETVAALFAGGGLPGDVGHAAERLVAFWRQRNTRFSADERSAIFARMFGEGGGPVLAVRGARNVAFEGLLIDFADAVFAVAPGWGDRMSPADTIALRTAAAALAVNLVTRSTAVPDVAAAELVGAAQEALDIFKLPELQRVLGARSVWDALQAVDRRYLDADIDIASRVNRGRSGMVMLAWLAETLPALADDWVALPRPDPRATGAAGTWLHATLALREAEAAVSAAAQR